MSVLSSQNTALKNRKNKSYNLLKHEIKCHSMFNNMLNGNIYVKIEHDSIATNIDSALYDENAYNYIRLSILTDELIEYDTAMFDEQNKEKLLQSYRPYFVSFMIPFEENNNLHKLKELSNKWHVGCIENTYQDRHQDENQEEHIILNGILETSASPINYIKKRLLIFNDKTMDPATLKKINETYDSNKFSCVKSKDIADILNISWDKDNLETIDIYNVGHGNADYLKGKNHRILYDIGYNYHHLPNLHKDNYLRAVNAIRKLKPSCVILSHWDLDHIIGCAYAEQDIFKVKWIAPDFVSSQKGKSTPNRVRLANYLNVLGNLYLVDTKQTNKLIANISCANKTEMKLWLGCGNDKYIKSSNNCQGLIIEIINKKGRKILLAGDVPYKCMPDILDDPIDYMHVPHHCSNMELDRLKKSSSKGICAIISTDCKNGKLNVNDSHHNELKNKFYIVITTIGYPSKRCNTPLSVRIDCKKNNFYYR